MRKSRYRSQDAHRVKTQREGLYYAAAIPSTAWGPLLEKDPSFKLVVFDEDNISAKMQQEWFVRLREGELFSEPYLILITSNIDDDAAVSRGYDLMKRAVEKGIRVQITESSRISLEKRHSDEDVVMLTNIYDEAPTDRIQAIRDWCYQNDVCCRILCGTGDPADLMRRLKLKFNAVFYLDSKVVTEKSLA